MKLQYKAASAMFLFGIAVLITISIGYEYLTERSAAREMIVAISGMAEEVSSHVESKLQANARIAQTLASAPVVINALQESNRVFSELADDALKKEIVELNRQWKEAETVDDPFIQQYMTNQVAEFLKSQQTLFPEMYGEIFLTNRFGAMIATTGKLTTLAHAQKYWWLAAFDNGKGRIFIDDRGFDTSVQGYVIGIVVPVMEDGEIAGILKCNINIMGPMSHICDDFCENKQGSLQVARSGGLVVFESGKEPLSTRLPEALVAGLQQRSAGTAVINENGREQLVAYQPVHITMGSTEIGFGGKYESIDHIKGNLGESWFTVVSREQKEVEALAAQSRYLIILSGGLLVLVMAVIALLLGKTVAKPVMILAEAAGSIGAGNLDMQIKASSRDEIGLLAGSLNSMASDLKKTMASRDELQHEVSQRRQAEEQLQSSKEALERSNKELEHFAYIVSHDLQEPLRMVSSYVQLLARRYQDKLDDDANDFIHYAVDGADRMSTMINALLSYSRVGTRGSALVPVSLENVLQQARDNLQVAIQESSADISHVELPTVMADESLLIQLFQNLLGNAIKFRRPDQQLKVNFRVEKGDSQWIFSVTDNGIGIAQENFDRIFKIFQRLHSRDEIPGTGIGLSVCRRIVERHGGRLWLESTEGEGTTFYFTLPGSEK